MNPPAGYVQPPFDRLCDLIDKSWTPGGRLEDEEWKEYYDLFDAASGTPDYEVAVRYERKAEERYWAMQREDGDDDDA